MIAHCWQAGITAYVPQPIRGLVVRKGYFAEELFRYGPAVDIYICLGGTTLYPRHKGKVRDNRKIEYCNRAACKGCAPKPRCTGNPCRRVSRRENEAVLDRMAARLEARPIVLDRRRWTSSIPSEPSSNG